MENTWVNRKGKCCVMECLKYYVDVNISHCNFVIAFLLRSNVLRTKILAAEKLSLYKIKNSLIINIGYANEAFLFLFRRIGELLSFDEWK